MNIFFKTSKPLGQELGLFDALFKPLLNAAAAEKPCLNELCSAPLI